MPPGGAGGSSAQNSTVATGTDNPGRPTPRLWAGVGQQPAIFRRGIPTAGRLGVPGAVMKGGGSCRRGGNVPGNRGYEAVDHPDRDGRGAPCTAGAGGFR